MMYYFNFLSLGTKYSGYRLSRRPNTVGAVCPGGPEVGGAVYPRELNVWRSDVPGPNSSQSLFFNYNLNKFEEMFELKIWSDNDVTWKDPLKIYFRQFLPVKTPQKL